VINDQDFVLEEARMRTLQESVRQWAHAFPGARMVIEAGTHSGWMSRLLEELGHEIIGGNAREIASLRRTNSNDRRDAQRLARYGRIDPALLAPSAHRSEELQLDLAVIKVRERLVLARAMMINTVKGLMKSFGFPPPAGCRDVFAKRCPEVIGEQLVRIVQPLLEQIAALTLTIKASACTIEEIAEQRYLPRQLAHGC
jgi:transposase